MTIYVSCPPALSSLYPTMSYLAFLVFKKYILYIRYILTAVSLISAPPNPPPPLSSSSTSLPFSEKGVGERLHRISTEHGITNYNEVRNKHSCQGWLRWPSGSKRVPNAEQSVKNNHIIVHSPGEAKQHRGLKVGTHESPWAGENKINLAGGLGVGRDWTGKSVQAGGGWQRERVLREMAEPGGQRGWLDPGDSEGFLSLYPNFQHYAWKGESAS